MKKYVIVSLVATSLLMVAQPAAAANLEGATSVQSGTFAGARVRISLGGKMQDRKVRAGLALAPTLRSQARSGEFRTRIGDGLELGFNGQRPLALSLAGRPVSRLLPGGDRSEDERRLGISTGGYVAIGVGVAALVGAFVLYETYKEADENSD